MQGYSGKTDTELAVELDAHAERLLGMNQVACVLRYWARVMTGPAQNRTQADRQFAIAALLIADAIEIDVASGRVKTEKPLPA